MSSPKSGSSLPVPSFFDPARVGEIWPVPYQERAAQALEWAEQHGLTPTADDRFKTALVLIDVQNTFSIPGFELFVGGRSGTGAVDDNIRLCRVHLPQSGPPDPRFRNHGYAFCHADLPPHPAGGQETAGTPNPTPWSPTQMSARGAGSSTRLRREMLGLDPGYAQRHLLHYTAELKEREKFDLTIWPYHAMLGGIGHALVPAVEEAVFFHTVARYSQPEIEIKGKNPLTEHYSALGPEVQEGPDGRKLASKNERFVHLVEEYDAVIIAGQAKSHCVAWTVADLLEGLRRPATLPWPRRFTCWRTAPAR
jgi:nicotinamidase-related amidase